ncbi:hypothetical protein ES702_05673 [subsurface metagenome]
MVPCSTSISGYEEGLLRVFSGWDGLVLGLAADACEFTWGLRCCERMLVAVRVWVWGVNA